MRDAAHSSMCCCLSSRSSVGDVQYELGQTRRTRLLLGTIDTSVNGRSLPSTRFRSNKGNARSLSRRAASVLCSSVKATNTSEKTCLVHRSHGTRSPRASPSRAACPTSIGRAVIERDTEKTTSSRRTEGECRSRAVTYQSMNGRASARATSESPFASIIIVGKVIDKSTTRENNNTPDDATGVVVANSSTEDERVANNDEECLSANEGREKELSDTMFSLPESSVV
jgi:hypothetical protein